MPVICVSHVFLAVNRKHTEISASSRYSLHLCQPDAFSLHGICKPTRLKISRACNIHIGKYRDLGRDMPWTLLRLGSPGSSIERISIHSLCASIERQLTSIAALLAWKCPSKYLIIIRRPTSDSLRWHSPLAAKMLVCPRQRLAETRKGMQRRLTATCLVHH